MPKSKRAKVVQLTKADKQGFEAKEKLVSDVQESIDEYAFIYLFKVNNMRNSKLKDIRQKWRQSRFFMGRNKVLALAFGKSEEEEYKPGTHQLTDNISGNVGVLFSNQDPTYVSKWFETYKEADFARAGDKATETIELAAGPLPQFAHSIEPHLRKLGLPSSLDKGVVTLLKDHTLCKAGEVLNADKANVLKLLGHQQATFSLNVSHSFTEDGGLQEMA